MNEETLFQEVCPHPEERAAFLEQACAGRPDAWLPSSRSWRRTKSRATSSTGPLPRPRIPALAQAQPTPPSTARRAGRRIVRGHLDG